MSFQFVIKTFERPECLTVLLESISRFYPDAIAWIADDSKTHFVSINPNHRILKCPFDIGLKCGRQVALACVQTEFFVLLDDDMKLTEKTNIEKLISWCQLGFDFSGGDVSDYGSPNTRRVMGRIQVINNIFSVAPLSQSDFGDDAISTDVLAGFYAARTNSVRGIGGWDTRLKIGGHSEIFIRAKKSGLKCAMIPSVIVEHWPVYSEHYRKFRDRNTEENAEFWGPIARDEYGFKNPRP